MNRFRLFLRVAQGLRTSQRFMRATVLPPYNLLAVQATLGSNNKCGQELQICRSNGNLAEPEYVVDNITYDRVCAETLDALSDYFDELTENATDLSGTDVVYGDGVLSVNLGSVNGIYVINRQKPNKQIWLSSPISGPKRFDYMLTPGQVTGRWVYKHTGETLHELLQKEIAKVFRGQSVNFSNLP